MTEKETFALQIPDGVFKVEPGIPLGDMLIQIQRQFPPFNFYFNKPEGMSTNDFLMLNKPVPFKYYFEYGQIKRWFLSVIGQAQADYKAGNVERAIWAYETLLEQRYPNYKPYDLLISIYRKQKDFENEQRVLRHSIDFFTEIRENQRKYVLSLAREYNMEWKALEYIEAGKKIWYYGGAFVLYDPVATLRLWEISLCKITSLNSIGGL